MEQFWQEYDAAAMDLARKGLTGKIGDPLPNLMSRECCDAINADPEAFEERVRLSAYALAMEKCNNEEYEPSMEEWAESWADRLSR